MIASVTPADDADFSGVTWASSDDTIATVTDEGVVDYKDVGTVVISAITIDGGFMANCTITIGADKTALRNAIEYYDTLTLNQYTPASLSSMLGVYDASSAVYSNALATQAETDTATSNLMAAYDALVPYVYISSATLGIDGVDQNGQVLIHVPHPDAYTSASVTLGVLFNPSDAMYESIAWSSSSPDVNVTQSGLVKATVNRECFATITATITDYFGNHYTAKAVVTFHKIAVKSITVTPATVIVPINSDAVQLTPTVLDEYDQPADFTGVVWQSSNPDVAAVDQNGLVTVGIEGTATITATTEIGALSATCTVTVTDTALSPQLNAATGSPVTFDRDNKITYGVPKDSADISQYFTTPCGELVYTPMLVGHYGTGTRIDVVFEDQVVDTYYVVILGDIDGDATIKASDALSVLKHVSGSVALNEIQQFAADVDHSDSIAASDALSILKYVSGSIAEL